MLKVFLKKKKRTFRGVLKNSSNEVFGKYLEKYLCTPSRMIHGNF